MQRVQLVKIDANISILERTPATPMERHMNTISVIPTRQFSQAMDDPIPALRKLLQAKEG